MWEWLKTTQGLLAALAAVLGIMGAWWQLGLPRVVFSDELAPRVQYDTAGTLGNGSWGYIVDTYDKDAGTTNNQRLHFNGTRVAQMSDTLPIDLNSAVLGIGRHVSGIADPFNGHIDEFRLFR
jgi:Concanavalin A-like lectin/glucanases superfamily